MRTGPHVILLAGPNGAGKSTLAPLLIREALGVTQYLNADEIARGLAGFDPDSAAMEAGRHLLGRLDQLATDRADFAIETTLSGRTLANWIGEQQRARGYRCHIAYLWPRSPEVALDRVRKRVASGGHSIPTDTVVRRYWRSLRNFAAIYRGLAESWLVYDNEEVMVPKAIAAGCYNEVTSVFNPPLWTAFCEQTQCR